VLTYTYDPINTTFDPDDEYDIKVRGRTSCGVGEWSPLFEQKFDTIPNQLPKVIVSQNANDVTFEF